MASGSLPNQYAELKRLIKQRGLLDQQPAYFAGKSLLTLGLLAVGTKPCPCLPGTASWTSRAGRN
jgi:hypothetical protein